MLPFSIFNVLALVDGRLHAESQICEGVPEPRAICFIVDQSKSMGVYMYDGMINAVWKYVSMLQDHYEDYPEKLDIGVITFSGDAQDRLGGMRKLSSGKIERDDFFQKLKRPDDYEDTNKTTHYDVFLVLAKKMLSGIAEDVRQDVFLFTDGRPNDYYEPWFHIINSKMEATPESSKETEKYAVKSMMDKFYRGSRRMVKISAIYVKVDDGFQKNKEVEMKERLSILGLLTQVAGCNDYQESASVGNGLDESSGTDINGELCNMFYVAGDQKEVFEKVGELAASALSVHDQCSHCQFTEPNAEGDFQITCLDGTKCAKDPDCCSKLGGAARCNMQNPYLVYIENKEPTCKPNLKKQCPVNKPGCDPSKYQLVEKCPKIKIPETTTAGPKSPCHPRAAKTTTQAQHDEA